jgi:hypothetical protein
MGEYTLSVKPSWIVLGIPVPGAENPFLAAPYPEEVRVRVSVDECSEAVVGVSGVGGLVASYLRQSATRLAEGLGGGLCIRVSVEAEGRKFSEAGLYAALSSAVAYALARWHGERPDTDDVMEIARLVDPEMPSEWSLALDALRYASLEGSLAVYRGEDERATLPGDPLDYEVARTVKSKQPIGRDEVGPDVSNALTHLAGVTVLTAAVLIRDGAPLSDVVKRLEPVEWGLAYAIWRLEPNSGCIPHPGLPGTFEISCPRS